MPEPRVDLNITPLIDVLLVLIVIFMAALPLTQKGIDTQLSAQPQPWGKAPQNEAGCRSRRDHPRRDAPGTPALDRCARSFGP